MRTTLARNLRKLMVESEDYKNATSLGKAAKIGRKTVERMMEGTNAATIDSLEAVATVLNVRPWQLLVEGMSARDLPQLRVPEGTEAELYSQLGTLTKAVRRLEEAAGPSYRRPKKAP